MKEVKTTLFLFLLAFSSKALNEIALRGDMTCFECIGVASVENWACKDNVKESRSYCCLEDVDDAGDKECNRNFCSTDAPTDAMKLYACPFISSHCGRSKAAMTAVFDESVSVTTSSSYDLGGVCYYEVTPAEGDSDKIFINFQALSITNTIITLSSGSSPTEIDDEIEVSIDNGYEQNMTANSTMWITVLAYGEDPEASFRVQLVKEAEPEPIVIPEKIRPTLEANEKLAGEVPPSDYQP